MKTDHELQRKVLAELKFEPSVDAAHVGVSVKDGVVTLTGHVSSYAEKYAAEQAAKRVQGVKAVANEIDVKLPGSSQRTDEDVAKDAAAALRSNTLVPADRIHVTVSSGWVRLEGEVEWHFQKEAAEGAVRNIPGVRGVSNLIRVKPKLTPEDFKAAIEAAFTRSAERDALRVRVEVQDSKVILRGKVRSWAEREEAERVAWSVPGVTEVENHIAVTREKPVWLWVAILFVVFSLLFAGVVWPEFLFPKFWPGPGVYKGDQGGSGEPPAGLPKEAVRPIVAASTVGLAASPQGGPLLAAALLFHQRAREARPDAARARGVPAGGPAGKSPGARAAP